MCVYNLAVLEIAPIAETVVEAARRLAILLEAIHLRIKALDVVIEIADVESVLIAMGVAVQKA